MRENAQRRDRPSPTDRCLPPPHTEHRHLSPLSSEMETVETAESFAIYKTAGNGEAIPVEAAGTLDAAVRCVLRLRECFPGEYTILSQATGKRIVFTQQGGIRRS